MPSRLHVMTTHTHTSVDMRDTDGFGGAHILCPLRPKPGFRDMNIKGSFRGVTRGLTLKKYNQLAVFAMNHMVNIFQQCMDQPGVVANPSLGPC